VKCTSQRIAFNNSGSCGRASQTGCSNHNPRDPHGVVTGAGLTPLEIANFLFIDDIKETVNGVQNGDPLVIGAGITKLVCKPCKVVDKTVDAAKDIRRASKKADLKRIHSDETLNSGSNKFELESQRTRSTEDLIDSLKPGAPEPLKVKPDGRIFDGNTRTKVLEERGIDINDLPRTIID